MRSRPGHGASAAVIFLVVVWTGLSGCAPTVPAPQDGPRPPAGLDFPGSLHETPVPEGGWRGHQLAGCAPEVAAPSRVEKLLALCAEFFREGSGSDGMIELELARERGVDHPLLDLTLGQLYLLAGQGEPQLLPAEGPAGDVGDWEKNRVRLLDRSRELLQKAAWARPDDAVVDYLLADAARAAGDQALASEYQEQGLNKCTAGRSMDILRRYQQLNRYPAKYLGGAAPEYPAEALAREISGPVDIDLLLDPTGRIRQAEAVSSPDPALSEAALRSLLEGRFEAARVGKYPVWSWLRVTIAFNLAR